MIYSYDVGTCEILVMYPTDVVKTRAQLSVGKLQQGMFSMLYGIYKQEGYLRSHFTNSTDSFDCTEEFCLLY